MTNIYSFVARISERKFKELLKMFCADVAALSASKLTVVNLAFTRKRAGFI